MPTVADTNALVADRVITREQADIIEKRAREIMVNLGINAVLCFGILAATAGLVLWLASAASVAIVGMVFLGGGLLVLANKSDLYRMFGNAGALIGAGMLIGGAWLELLNNYRDIAGWVALAGGIPVILLAGRSILHGGLTTRFVAGSILLMGLALHLVGLAEIISSKDLSGIPVMLSYLYAAIVIAIAGWAIDVRFVTALAIAPFAQVLDTSTNYFHAAYVFYSPESTLSILQMTLLIVACIWIAQRASEETARHLGILAIMAFIVANLCALVGSLWGDVVGSHLWGPGRWHYSSGGTWETYNEAVTAFRASALVISDGVYAIVWAIALTAAIFWAAHQSRRGLFNAAVTFAAIHAYTQLFESYYDEPLAYVIGGFAAIPLAWAMWRLNLRFLARSGAA